MLLKDRKFLEVIDGDWDDYEVGSSFVIEEPFSATSIDWKKYQAKYNSTVYWDATNKKGKKKNDSNRSRNGRSSSRKYVAKIQAIHLGGKRRSPNKSQCITEIQN